MQKSYLVYSVILFLLSITLPIVGAEKDTNSIPLDEFIKIAAKNDTGFEKILINELKLSYTKDLALPPRDIILSVMTCPPKIVPCKT